MPHDERTAAAPPASTPPLRVYRFQRDGDVLVFDPAHPGDGFVQFYSPARDELRKFVRDAIRPQLERVDDGDVSAQAVSAYRAWRRAHPVVSTEPAPRVPPVTKARPGAHRVRQVPVGPELAALLQLVQESETRPIFVTGRAGTGKSTALRELARIHHGQCVVLAPTGLAALNAGGQTIHSFFRFPLRPLTETDLRPGAWTSIARRLELLVIDEISMVRADVLDAIDRALQHARGTRTAFGGVKLVLFGDPYQLPPIVSRGHEEAFRDLRYRSPWFFDARVLQRAPLRMFEFTTVHRQRDPEWIALLDRVRTADPTNADLEQLRARVERVDTGELNDTIVLTAYRRTAEEINTRRLHALDDQPVTFGAERSGVFLRDTGEGADPAPDPLVLKRGARVMFVKNDPDQGWVNGSLGDVERLAADHAVVHLDDGTRVTVTAQEWVQQEYGLDAHGEVCTQPVGRFRQLPLQLAWAVTIHKSQGLTFDRVHLDLGRGAFSPGQSYVALSRCRTLEGMTLQQPLRAGDVQSDARVEEFFTMVRR